MEGGRRKIIYSVWDIVVLDVPISFLWKRISKTLYRQMVGW